MTDQTNIDYRNKPTSTLTGLTYMLIGGGIGAAAALLFAPKPGSDMRHDISDATRKSLDGTLDLAKRLKERSVGLYRSAADKVNGLDEGADQILELGTTRQKRFENAASAENLSVSFDQSPARARESGRKSSGII